MRIAELTTIEYTESQRDRFRSGELVRIWAKQYPKIFDKDDIRITRKQPNYHFFEWLAAVIIYNSTNYLSLIEKYEFQNHERKQKILRKLMTNEQIAQIYLNGAQCPDLLSYSPDYRDWFFCELKGSRDKLRKEQITYFEKLEKFTGKRTYIIEFKEKNPDKQVAR
jgi:hypothetical protein